MECVGEDDVAEDVMRAVVGNVDGGIELEIARQVTREPGGNGVA